MGRRPQLGYARPVRSISDAHLLSPAPDGVGRGIRDGIDAGTILAVDEAGATVRDTYANGASFTRKSTSYGASFAMRVKLPDEREGTLLVFKSFDRVSYGLIVGASSAIHVQDIVRNP